MGVIQDGAPELWHLLPAAVVAEPQVTRYEAIDRYHLNERLGAVLRVLAPDAATRATRLSQWNESLDRNDGAVYRIREGIRTAYAGALARQDTAASDQLALHVTYPGTPCLVAALCATPRGRVTRRERGHGGGLSVRHRAAHEWAESAMAH